MTRQLDTFKTTSILETAGGSYTYFSLPKLEEAGLCDLDSLPYSIRVLLEAVLRGEDGCLITEADVRALAAYDGENLTPFNVPFNPGRVLLQDFTGVPAVVDLAAMRTAMGRRGKDPARINPMIPVDLVIDHSVQVDHYGTPEALGFNEDLEFERNQERYAFLRWGQKAFSNFRVVPPTSGICHQVNLEHLAQVARVDEVDGGRMVIPDTLVGTDSHTTMIGGLGVVGWGVGGIEAEAVMLGQPLYMLAPPVVGVELTGRLPEGTTATDLVLMVTQRLRAHGVVGKFVEFHGPGLDTLTVPDRATIANMAPEYGATIGFFPVDRRTLSFLADTGRPAALVKLVEQYYTAQKLFRTPDAKTPRFTENLTIDLSQVQPCMAGPKRPQDKLLLEDIKSAWKTSLSAPQEKMGYGMSQDATGKTVSVDLPDKGTVTLSNGAVAIAAITSCTNTSNPTVMLAAGLLAKKAVEKGLTVKPWVKTSLAPGSTVVTEYLTASGTLPFLEALGFHVVGYGCTTCIGNSGPLDPPIAQAVTDHGLILAGVLSGNRNFEGRINPHVKANYLASPPLVVAYALAGTVNIDLTTEPIGIGADGAPVTLADIWPSSEEIAQLLSSAFSPEVFARKYGDIENGNPRWNQIPAAAGDLYPWGDESTYIHEPPFFSDEALETRPITPITGARALLKLGDSITTDHISPAGNISETSAAGVFLTSRGVARSAFNSYGSRRGNDLVMTRGTFANVRLRNHLAPGTEGGMTTHHPTGDVISVHEAAMRYRAAGTPTVVIAGTDYGMGSSRDWAAKGSALLGIRAVIARSFERIHRSNLVGMGILPLQFKPGQDASTLGIHGDEEFEIPIHDHVEPGQEIIVTAAGPRGTITFPTLARLDTQVDVQYYRDGGILLTVLKAFLDKSH